MIKAIISKIEEPRAAVRILYVRTKSPVAYRAGQYIWLAFDGYEPRPFSIANRPGTDIIEIHIKENGYNGASHYAVTKAIEGENVEIHGTGGEHTYTPDSAHKPILLIGGGLGFTPLKAIIEEALHESADKRTQPLYFYWGAESEDHLYMRAYFENLAQENDNFIFKAEIERPVGEVACEQFTDLTDFEIFLAGPSAMIEATLPLLEEKKAQPEAIYYDRWDRVITNKAVIS